MSATWKTAAPGAARRGPDLRAAPSRAAAAVCASAALAVALACAAAIDRSNVTETSVLVQVDPEKPPQRSTTVVRGQPYRIAVTLEWEKGRAGRHQRTWKYFQAGNLLGEQTRRVSLKRSPYTMTLDAGSTDKQPGDYQYQLYIDGALVASVNLTIVDR
jgi:hypothetical protein